MLTKRDYQELREWKDPFEDNKENKMRDENIGFLKKTLLKVITFFQEQSLRQENTDFYYKLVRWHYRLYFGYPLEEALTNGPTMRAAQHRHACMVLAKVYPNAGPALQKSIYRLAKRSFAKNLMLRTPLE